MKLCAPILCLMIAGLVAGGSFAQQAEPPKKPNMTLEERFNKMDANHDGILTEEEFFAFHKKMAKQVAKSVFAKVGGTEDRPLTVDQLDEAREAWANKIAPSQKEETLKMTTEEIFETIDANQDGKVSEAELADYLVNQGRERAETVFRSMGGTKEEGLSFAQFQKGVYARWEGMARRHKEGTRVK